MDAEAEAVIKPGPQGESSGFCSPRSSQAAPTLALQSLQVPHLLTTVCRQAVPGVL